MTIPKFDNRAKAALAIAQQIAQELRHSYIGSEHLLYGILSQPQNDLPFQMAFIDGMSNQELLEIIRRMGNESEEMKNSEIDTEFTIPDITEELQQCLDKSIKVAENFNFPYVGLEHLIFGILDTANSSGKKLMNLNDANSKKIKDILYSVFENYKRGVRTGEKNFKPKFNKRDSVLGNYTKNLNKKISKEPNFQIIEREKEVDRIVQILSRKNKNNPILLGEPGVGKTALVEGLAKRINSKKVPEWLQDKQILSLDIGSLIAGTMFRGEFENRIKAIFDEVVESKDVILFIDEIHTAIGAGNSSQGGPDLSSILKPALSRGEISIIGATTKEEYRTIIKKDKAFERRFQVINMDEPDHSQVINILRGTKVMYENYHRALFPDELLPELVNLTARFLPERHFPDKALDILDETLVRCRLQNMVKVNEDRQKEKSWVELEKQILALIKKKNEAILAQNFELSQKFAEEQKELEQELSKLNLPSKDQLPNSKVTKEILEKTVSEVSGVPLVRVSSDIFTQIKDLEGVLNNQIFGQPEASKEVTKALKRAYAGVNPNKGPMASFMLLGPTGVGKTELVKVIAKELYGDPSKYLLKLDMSEFSEKHTVSRLLGSPAGYVGYDDAPELIDFIRNNPYSVILFDEIEKGNKDILNILLQMLEDGVITDAKGNTVSIEHTLIFLTSNLGKNKLNKFVSKMGFVDFTDSETEDYNQIKAQVMGEVERSIKPEILGRINSKIVFRPIGKTVLKQIIKKELSVLQNHMLKNGRSVSIKDTVIESVASKAKEKLEYGAREVKSLIAAEVQDLIAEFVLDYPESLNLEIVVNRSGNIEVKPKKGKAKVKLVEEVALVDKKKN